MTEKELHWHANDLINKGIFSIQLEIEGYKEELKFLQGGEGRRSAIHDPARETTLISLLETTRNELKIHEYMQGLLDQAAEEKSTMETVQNYLSKQNLTRNT